MPDAPLIRLARPEEAPALLGLAARVDAEAPYLPREPGERPVWSDLPAFLARGNCALFTALDGADRPVGWLSAAGGRFARNRGVATLAAGVLDGHRGRGLGTRLFAAAEAWARDAGLHRLELTVVTANARAHALYRRLGFIDEGVMRGSLRIAGRFHDEAILAKHLAGDGPDQPPLVLEAPPPAACPTEIREAGPSDAAAYLAYDRAVRGETHFLLRKAEEALADAEAARRFLAGQRASRNAVTLIACAPEGIVGSVSLWAGPQARSAHEGSLGLAVRRAFWGGGVGRALLEAAEARARGMGARRLSLWVMGHNVRARRLYAAAGYAEEAVCRRYALIDGRFADHVLMAKRLA